MYQSSKQAAKAYDLFSTGLSGDKKFYLSESKKAKGRVLEIAVGTGRIFLDIIRNKIDVHGFDISTNMLAELKIKAKRQKLNITDRVSKQDMRSFHLKGKFDLIIIPYRAFLHNETKQDQLSTLHRCYKHLKPHGKLILNFFHFSPTIVSQRLQDKKGKRLVKTIKRKNYQLKIYDETNYDFLGQKIHVIFYFEEKNKNELPKKFKKSFTINWIGVREFKHLADKNGFKVLKLFGGFDKRPFRKENDELIWVLIKK